MGTGPTQVPTALAILNAGGTVLASAGFSGTTDFGSAEAFDSRLSFTAATAGTYYIRLGELETDYVTSGAFEGGEQALLNVTVTGHAATAAPIEAGNDVISGGDGADTIVGMLGSDTVHGDAGSDTIYSTGNGSYFGDAGNDRIYATPGVPETLDGGADHDTLDTTSWSSGYVINLVTGVTNYLFESFVNFESVTTGAGGDTITGTAGFNVIQTNNGNDTVYAGDGGDLVYGGQGNDVLYGEGGADSLYDGYNSLANDIDTLDGGAGDDTVVYENGTQNGGGAHGGTGIDTLFIYNAAPGDISVQLEGVTTHGAMVMASDGFENFTTYGINNFTVFGTAGANRIVTAGGNDTLRGGGGDDVLSGGAGNDVLVAGAGADAMDGGLGDDTYYADHLGDTVTEATDAGWDVVQATIDHVLADNVEELVLGGAGRDGTGNVLGNILRGSGSNNVLSGLGGADTLRGSGGRDTLLGGNGEDLLDGGVGKDTMTGGAARDVFQFRDGDFGATRALADVITDFSHADAEKINLNLVDANVIAGGNQAFAFIGSGAFTGVAGQLHYAQAAGNTYVEGDTNGDGLADFVIALTGLHGLVASDFVL